MEDLKKAKERAEGYLSHIVKKSWNCLVRIDKDENIPDNWPLQFEAHAYLGLKHKELIPEFSKRVRHLWLNWRERYEKEKYGKYKFFWPAIEEFRIPVNHEEADWEPGFEIESHIAMFRAKENLYIEGFETYFKEAKKRLRSLLIEEDVLKSSDKNRIIYQIVRSPMLRLLLKNYIKNLASRIIEDEVLEEYLELESEGLEFKKRGFIVETGSWARAIFFLIISNLGGESEKLAIEILKKMIDGQENNGSFNDDILTTCLAISSIYIMGLDLYGIICEGAIKWLLDKQNEDGSWKHWRLSMIGLPPESHVLATVVVLETLDLITDDKPLPIWAVKTTDDISRKQKQKKIQDIKLLEIDKKITWADVSIYFISDEDVEIRAGKPIGLKNFRALGFKNQRTDKPIKIWETLKLFAKCKGEISWKDNVMETEDIQAFQKHVSLLRDKLKLLFDIEENPFEPYKKIKAYKLKPTIYIKEGREDDVFSSS